MSDHPPESRRLTQAEADALVGKKILIGVTYLDHKGEEVQCTQMHGVITSASEGGVMVSLEGSNHGRSFSLPPDPAFFSRAKRGKYTLHSTGEVISNPDLTCTATIREEQKN